MIRQMFENNRKFILLYFVAFTILSGLISAKLTVSYYTTYNSAQLALAKQYIEIAKDIETGLDKQVYERFLKSKDYNEDYASILNYLEGYQSKISSLYVYTLAFDESDVSKVMISTVPMGLPIGSACTVPSKEVFLAKQGQPYNTGLIQDGDNETYISVGTPLLSRTGELLGALGIDISVDNVKAVGDQVIRSNLIVFGVDILFVVLILAGSFYLWKWVQRHLKAEVQETEQVYVTEMEKIVDSVKSSKHDLANHIQVLKGMLDMQMTEKAKDYLRMLHEDNQFFNVSRSNINNPTLMVLFSIKSEFARSKRISMEFDMAPHRFSRIPSIDLVKIFSNLLDNAIEACELVDEEQRQIGVSCKIVGGKYVFTVENDAILSFEEQNLWFHKGYSTKHTKNSERGNGLSIIKHTVEKYNGEIVYSYENGKVRIQITI